MNHPKQRKKPNTRSKSEPNTKTLKKFYYEDKKILHFLQKDEVASHRLAQKHMKTDSYSILSKINSLFTLNDDLAYQRIKSDNTKFFNDFLRAKSQQQTKPQKETFKYLIKEYEDKGYKIPNLSLNHNLFKKTPLIEHNKEKLLTMFTLGNDHKRKRTLKKNVMSYLRKIKEMILEQIDHYKYNPNTNKLVCKHHFDIMNTESSIRTTKGNSENDNLKLLNEIADLITMIDECLIEKLNELFNDKKTKSINSYQKMNNDIEISDFGLLFPFTKKNTVLELQKNRTKNIKQSRNTNTERKMDIKQLKQRTFDSMNLERLANRSGLDYKTQTCSSEIKSKKPFFLCSPLPKRRRNHVPPSITSIFNQGTPTKQSNKQPQPFLIRSNTKQTVPNDNNPLNNINLTTRTVSSSNETFHRTTSTHFSTFKKGFGLGLTIRAKYKLKSDLILFAYNKCIERDFASVRRAFRILLEKYRKMDLEQIENYFEDVISNSDPNIILKGLDKTKSIINKSNIEEKIRQIYSVENLAEIIKPKLDTLRNNDREINSLDKQFIKRVSKK